MCTCDQQAMVSLPAQFLRIVDGTRIVSCTTVVVHNRDHPFFSEFLIEHTPKLHLNISNNHKRILRSKFGLTTAQLVSFKSIEMDKTIFLKILKFT